MKRTIRFDSARFREVGFDLAVRRFRSRRSSVFHDIGDAFGMLEGTMTTNQVRRSVARVNLTSIGFNRAFAGFRLRELSGMG